MFRYHQIDDMNIIYKINRADIICSGLWDRTTRKQMKEKRVNAIKIHLIVAATLQPRPMTSKSMNFLSSQY